MHFKRWLFLTHRWIGIASCLLFCLWFLSGLVMIYVPYPSLSMQDRVAASEPIDWRQVDTPPPLQAASPRRLELVMRDAVPVWRIQDDSGAWAVRSARRGAELDEVGATYARRVAQRFAGVSVTDVARVTRDQWTVAGGFDTHRPLWKARLDDAAGTVLYISSSTGAVVQRTTRVARFWNWLGSVPHWIYPTVLRQDGGAWRLVVLWVSGPCIAAAVTGFWIGLLRIRTGSRRFQDGRMTPYRGWMLWHHIAGLTGGLFLIAWIFSGWLSVDPGRLFAGKDPDAHAVQNYAVDPTPTSADLARLRALAPSARLIRFQHNAGLATATVHEPDLQPTVIALAAMRPAPLATTAIARAATPLVVGGRRIEAQLLTTPDDYWYAIGERPQLPILRLRFDDPARSWLYLDPRTGEVLQALDRRRRLYRWLFDLLHKWDLPVLTGHRPAWDALLWLGSLLGLITSVSALYLAWRRLAGRKAALR
jgi:uncharacterized iron-regulated membrane protein